MEVVLNNVENYVQNLDLARAIIDPRKPHKDWLEQVLPINDLARWAPAIRHLLRLDLAQEIHQKSRAAAVQEIIEVLKRVNNVFLTLQPISRVQGAFIQCDPAGALALILEMPKESVAISMLSYGELCTMVTKIPPIFLNTMLGCEIPQSSLERSQTGFCRAISRNDPFHPMWAAENKINHKCYYLDRPSPTKFEDWVRCFVRRALATGDIFPATAREGASSLSWEYCIHENIKGNLENLLRWRVGLVLLKMARKERAVEISVALDNLLNLFLRGIPLVMFFPSGRGAWTPLGRREEIPPRAWFLAA